MAPVMDETNIVLRQFANLHTFGRVVSRAVVSGGARDALAPPEFRSSVNPIPTREGADYAHHNTASTPGFENLTTSVRCKNECF